MSGVQAILFFSLTLREICLTLIKYTVPPVGVFLIAGCGADLLINICLTLLGYIPGHIHAFYLEYVYYERRDRGNHGSYAAPGVYSERVLAGGGGQGQSYGTIR